jgi:hypothetical protein
LRKNLDSFSLGSIIKKLNRIHVRINAKNKRLFPKPQSLWLSQYNYQRRYIKIHPDGRVVGGLSRFVSSLIDFSFIRSIVAHKYSPFGFAYDPVSLFLLELFRYLEKYPNMKTFLHVVRDPVKGKHYRFYAGISDQAIPCEATFTNFKDRLGESLYNRIFHTLVKIAELLGFISFKILATDGTLFPTNARYKGCAYFCKDCENIEFRGIIDNVRKRILYRLADPRKIVMGKEIRIRADCPSHRFPPDIPRPRVEILTLCLQETDPENLATKTAGNPSIFNQIFNLQEELQTAGLDLIFKRGVITKIAFHDSTKNDAFFFRCPKLPTDMDARIGVRRNPQNPNQKQKIFGFNAVIDTSIELELGLELPVACTTLAGNAQEGKHFITNRQQLLAHHGKTSRLDLADAKYDELDNYAFSRSQGAIPLIDYNPRNENLTQQALKQRGYDQNGWPYAPCGILTRPNGFDFNSQRASFTCRRQCLDSKDQKVINFSQSCPHWINYHGFTKHMSIKQFPRLITEVLRGTYRHQKLRALRSAAERTNATAKNDFSILDRPKIRGIQHASVLSQMAVIVILLKKIASFIIKVTLALRKKPLRKSTHTQRFFIPGPKVDNFICNLIHRE